MELSVFPRLKSLDLGHLLGSFSLSLSLPLPHIRRCTYVCTRSSRLNSNCIFVKGLFACRCTVLCIGPTVAVAYRELFIACLFPPFPSKQGQKSCC